jgi:hypothetical protein
MSKDMRVGERVALEEDVEVKDPDTEDSWTVEGYDLSPTAIALMVPTDHDLMEEVPDLFKPGNPVVLEHDRFDEKKAVLHRIFSHRGDYTKWVLSFLRSLNIR